MKVILVNEQQGTSKYKNFKEVEYMAQKFNAKEQIQTITMIFKDLDSND